MMPLTTQSTGESILLETATSTLFNSSTPITTPCWGGSKEAFAQKPAFSFRNSIATIWPCHITKARTPKCGCTIYSRRRSSTPVMLRRKFAKASLGAIASSPFFHSAKGAPLPARDDFPQVHGLTNYVGKFVVETRYEDRSEEHTSELQSRLHLVCRLLLEKKKKNSTSYLYTTTTTQ